MKQYKDLLQTILEKGTYKAPARENMPGTTSYFGYQFRHNLLDGFPILTTKKLSFKNIVVELLWFLRGDTNIKFLIDNGCNIWNEDQQMFQNRNNWTEEGNTGYQYPWLWRSWGKEDRKWQPKPNFIDPRFGEIPTICESKSKYVGQTILTTQGYEYIIYDFDAISNTYKICFTHNGLCLEKKTSKNFEAVEYPYHKTCLEIACIGLVNMKDKKLRNKLYSTWRGMINRCYDKTNISYPLYGGKGVFVEDRWLCFEYFVEDAQSIPNWSDKMQNWNKFTLEKDFGRGYIYSKQDCIWSKENFQRLNRTLQYTFENVQSGELFITNNIADFARKVGSERYVNSCAYKLIQGQLKTIKGWRLKEAKDFEAKSVDQIKNLIKGLKENPMGRRHIITAWNPATLDDMALNACHAFVQFNCRPIPWEVKLEMAKRHPNVDMENLAITEAVAGNPNFGPIPQYYLDCQMYQRSADAFLGVPYNIASYALLTEILSKICNMIPGDFIHTFGDVHIYDNHQEQVEEQLKREPKSLPRLVINDEFWNPENSLSSDIAIIEGIQIEDFELKGYYPHPAIKAELSTGLKK